MNGVTGMKTLLKVVSGGDALMNRTSSPMWSLRRRHAGRLANSMHRMKCYEKTKRLLITSNDKIGS